MSMKLQLQVGKRYVDRRGKVTGYLHDFSERSTIYPFRCPLLCSIYTPAGKFREGSEEHQFDLVYEYTEPQEGFEDLTEADHKAIDDYAAQGAEIDPYKVMLNGVLLDPYRIAVLYQLKDPIVFQILKKALRFGRKHKSQVKDVTECITSGIRWLEIHSPADAEQFKKGGALLRWREHCSRERKDLTAAKQQLAEALYDKEQAINKQAECMKAADNAEQRLDEVTKQRDDARSWKKALDEDLSSTRTELAEEKQVTRRLAKERDALQEWKESAMQVGSSWDAQAIGQLLGVPLGCAILPQIEPAIRKMIAQRDEVITEATALLSIIESDENELSVLTSMVNGMRKILAAKGGDQ